MVEMVIIGLIIVDLIAYYKYRDVLNPAVLQPIMWIAALVLVPTFNVNDELKVGAFIVIILGSIVFQLGFAFALRVKSRFNSNYYVSGRTSINKQTIKMLIIVLLIVALPVIVQYWRYLHSSGTTIYRLLRSADSDLSLPTLFSYYRRVVQFISLCFFIIYWRLQSEERKSVRLYMIVLFILSVLTVISVPTRNNILFYFLPLFIIYFTTHNYSNKKVVIIGLVFIAAFMGVFALISAGKYSYVYEAASNSRTVLQDEIKGYLSGGIVAFCSNIYENSYIYHGQNTFRMLYAISDRIFGTSLAVKLTNQFVRIGNSTTNVFTFYDFYLRDFGIGYAIFAQFIVGAIHARAYKGMTRNNPSHIYWNALLTYPLIMQFFQDQYLALLSTWIQALIVGILIFNTRVFFSYTEESIEGYDTCKEI